MPPWRAERSNGPLQGQIVLNGTSGDGTAHVRGEITDEGGGLFSFLVEVSFNPQPEPPPGA